MDPGWKGRELEVGQKLRTQAQARVQKARAKGGGGKGRSKMTLQGMGTGQHTRVTSQRSPKKGE